MQNGIDYKSNMKIK